MKFEELKNIFTYHRPVGTQSERYQLLRADGHKLATTVLQLCPESRERSLAITNIQQAIMWANAAIAINESTEVQTYEKPVSREEMP